MDSKSKTEQNRGYIRVPAGEKFWNLLEFIFTDAFMKEYTNFENFEYFQYSSAVMVNWGCEEMIYHKEIFDHFITESTRFHSWDEMIMKAADLKFATKREVQE